MSTRLPSKSLEGRRVRLLHCHNVEDGSTGTISSVDTVTGNINVVLEAGGNAVANWADGDRWMVIPETVPVHPMAV